MAKFFLKNSFAIIAIALALFVYFPFYFQFSYDLGSSSILSEDQQAYITTIFRILYPNGEGYWSSFLAFAYGPVFWAIPALLALPFKIIGFEPGVLLMIYFVPFICFVSIAYLLLLIAKEYELQKMRPFYRMLGRGAIFLCFFTPIILRNTLQIRAEIVLSFFSLLSFYFLLLDKN